MGKIPALLITIFLGYLGVHKFLSGHIGMGVLYIFTFGLFGIGTIIDIVKICMGTYVDKNGNPWGVD